VNEVTLRINKEPFAVQNSHPQTTRRYIPGHKENKHEAGRTKKFA